MYLGLDLRGGVHFLLQVDMKAALDKAADRYTTDIRSLLREKKVQYSGVAREGTNVAVRFRDEAERTRARGEIEKAFPDLAMREAEGAPGELPSRRHAEARRRRSASRMAPCSRTSPSCATASTSSGVAEPIVQQQGADRVVVQLPGVQDTARAKDILGRTATLEIRMVNDDTGALEAALAGSPPLGSDIYTERSGGPLLVRRQVVLTGDRINDAQPGFDQRNNEPAVHVSLDGTGARIFKEVTRENVGKRMAIVLVEKGKAEVITAPGDPRGDRRRTGPDQRPDEHPRGERHRAPDARRRAGGADGDRRGAHRRPVARQGEHRQGVQLGLLRLHRAVDLHVRLLRLMGLISTIALSVNLMLLVALLSMLQATLTLPGIAAIAPHARHGHRLQRADQRAHPRGAALGRHSRMRR
jgi:preprotein translocase subunit SecD